MSPQITIRERTPRDLTHAAHTLVEVHEVDGYPVEGVDDPKAWLSPPELDRAWVAELDGTVIAHVALTRPSSEDAAPRQLAKESYAPSNQVMMLGRLFVHPSARGLAIGERLVRAVMSHATSAGQTLTLDVMQKDYAAIRLYERLGWSFIGSTDHRFGVKQSTPALCYIAPQEFPTSKHDQIAE